ncbi:MULTISPECIES: GIY-YIG nuclease family protein [unclassified Knoellia]|uniref:GIY-YIG nuclease family protein n=1 Tax=Knoellia altitudinis TaxID=3404795 RepID=UPI00361418E3
MTSVLVVADALVGLAGERQNREQAAVSAPHVAGLYAFYGDERAWRELGLEPILGQPLYVGKAERSLNGRDVGTHFCTGKTGSSTVRRSLAALLVDRLGLVAVPRNLARPDGSANFGLAPDGDALLSEWMDERLSLVVWVKPEGAPLGDVETKVVRKLDPPLNLDKVGQPRARLRLARKRMADASREWPPSSNPTTR